MSLLFIIVSVWIFIQTPFGQNWIARQVTSRLSKDLQTKVSIKHVDFALFNKMHLQGVLIEDRNQDTLLYAGDIQVRITDWFFFKKQATLKYIGLEDAVVKFQRTDSVWRQQFFLDYFSSPSSGKKKKAGIEFDLKKVELKNVQFIKKDGWLGEDMTVRLGTMDMDANELNLSGSSYDINTLYLKDPIIAIHKYDGKKPPDTLSPVAIAGATKTDSLLIWNTGRSVVKIGNMKIVNGVFKTDEDTDRDPYTYFDGQHILFSEINGEITKAQFVGDTVFSKVQLSAKERSGFELKNLTADLKLTPKGIAFSNLDIRTNKSIIKNYFMMGFDNFGDMGDFIHKVKMAANFDESEIDSDDIAFFAPALKNWKKKIKLKGKVRGAIDDLVGKDMIIQAGNSTLLNGDISLTGLPDINHTFIDFKASDFKTTYADAVTIVPAMRQVTSPDLRTIQYMHFKGSFTGFIRDFVTFGVIQTNLGTIKTDLNMKLPVGGEPVYSGNISTDNFRLGEFLNDPAIGVVSLDGTVKGKGFNPSTRNTLLDGTIHFADYNNYRYQNIVIKGKLDKKLFDGFATIDDENAKLTLNGIIDFNSTTPRFDLTADVQKANLKNLKLTNDSLEFKGKFNFDFTSSTLDNFLGSARVTEAELMKDGHRLPFDSLIVSSSFTNNVKSLTAVSNEFAATVTGDFSINDLPAAFTLFLNKYYPAYIKAPARMPRNQAITFDIVTHNVEEYLHIVDSSISGLNESHISGNLNLATNELNLDATVPQFKYKQYNFDNVTLAARGTFDNLSLKGNASNIRISDSMNIPMAIFNIDAHNDSSKVSIVAGANQTVDKANLNALVLTYNDGVKIEFDPSSFIINGKTWSIDESGELEFRKSHPASGQLVLREGEQKIMLKTQPSPTGNWNDLKVELTKINIGDLSPFFLPHNRLEGLISGNIMVEDPTNNLRVTSDDLQTQFLRLDNDSIGEVKINLAYDNKTQELKAKGATANQENSLAFDLDLFFDPLKSQNNIIALKPKNFEIKILERFLGNLFSDMQGYLTGDIDIKGKFDKLSVTGKGKLKDAGLKVNFTQCFYKVQDTEIELTPTNINLNNIVLTDPITGNSVYLNGGIQHESFQNMFYDLYISTRKPNTTDEANNQPVLLLNTTYRDNKQFYGKVLGTGSLSLAGPQSEMFMKIDAIASTKDSSSITIPSSQNRESGIADFLVERKYGREMNDSGLNINGTNIIYDVDVNANRMVDVKVVLDDLTGDEIKGKGQGTLNIHSGTSEPLSIRGRFDIEEGNYLFTFQSFFKKPFELRKGGTNYIEWNGDPYKANIHFDAVYKAENVSFAPLVNAYGLDPGFSRYRDNVFVVVTMSNELFDPRFDFKLELPANSRAINDPAISFGIQQIEKSPNEINRQITYLIVFNSFAPPDNALSSALNEFTYSTISSISGLFFNEINRELTKALSKIFNSDKVSINLSGSVYNRNLLTQQTKSGFNINQTNFDINIPISLFKDRFIITLGSTLDVPLQSTLQQSVEFLPDVTAEWLINPSGTIRATFFYRQNLDYITTNNSGAGRNKSTGASIAYRNDFDNLRDLFQSRKKPKAHDNAPPVQEAKKEDNVGEKPGN